MPLVKLPNATPLAQMFLNLQFQEKKITKEVISFAFTLVAKLIPLVYLLISPPCSCFKHKTGVRVGFG